MQFFEHTVFTDVKREVDPFGESMNREWKKGAQSPTFLYLSNLLQSKGKENLPT